MTIEAGHYDRLQKEKYFVNPHEYETLFHLVANAARDSDGDRYEFLTALSNKVGKHGTTYLKLNQGVEKSFIEEVKASARHAENQKDLDFYLETIRGMRL